MSTRRLPRSLILAAAFLAVALVAPPMSGTRAADPEDAPMLLGFATLDWRADLPALESEVGTPPSLFQLYWGLEAGWPNAWGPAMLEELHDLGITPFIEITTDDPTALAAGGLDTQLQGLVSSVQDWLAIGPGRRLLIAPLPEANLGEWPWGGDPDLYKAGYDRIRDAFNDAGIDQDRVRFVFAMNGLSDPGLSYDMFYPGDSKVDILGFSKLNRGNPWRDYDVTFGMHIEQMQAQVGHAKPIIITQTGSVDGGPGRSGWLSEMFSRLPTEGQVIGAVYFNRDKSGNDFRVLVGDTVEPAFESGYSTWSGRSDVAWIFDGRMDAWVAARQAQPKERFVDIAGSPFHKEILWIAEQGITQGCSPDRYCPLDPVSRGQMASFLARAIGLPAASSDYFIDDDGTTHEDNIDRIREASVTLGCSEDRYCPNARVTRAQMASFLARALDLPGAGTDFFVDDEGSPHEDNINRVAKAGITRGCNPPDRDNYCPNKNVTRGQMAAFLYRAFAGG